jgi:hypothetical protein
MGFLDKAKSAAEQAALKAKETAGELQTKRELGQAYSELGRKTFDLVESRELANPELDTIAERIRSLKAELEADEPDAEAEDAQPAEAAASTTTA